MIKSTYFLGLILSISALADFYISEIFANTPGRMSNKGNAWIELANISEHQIAVSHVRLEIYGSQSQLLFEHQLELLPKILFENRLLLLSKQDMVPGYCLNDRVDYVLMPSFELPTTKQKICVTINHSVRDCATLTAQDRFSDGVALYRSHDGQRAHGLWFSEPCHLKDKIFATPGLTERACLNDENFSLEILSDCTKAAPFYHAKSKALLGSKSSSPNLVLVSSSTVRVSDADQSDLFLLSQCASPESSKLICHELSKPQSISKERDHPFKEVEAAFDPSALLSLRVRDLYGLESSVSMPKKSRASANTLNELKAQTAWLEEHRLKVTLPLPKDLVPINFWLSDRDGDVLMAGAFHSAGEKTIYLNTKDSSGDLSLLLKTLHEEHSLSLSEDEKRGGCSTSLNTHWLALLALAMLRAFRPKAQVLDQSN